MDDVLVQGNTYEQMVSRVAEVLSNARDHGVTMSRAKIQHGREVKFASYIITSTADGVSVTLDPGLLEGLKNFPEPTNVTELRGSWGCRVS